MKVIVLGAGISGLALGWFLKQKYKDSIQLTILEKSTRSGGWIRTIEQEGFLFELGPRSCRTSGSGIECLKLIEELGLQDQITIADPAAKKRFLYLDQKLQALPSGLASFLWSPLSKGLFKAIWNDFFTPKSDLDDESIYDFIARRLSPDMAERFIDPLTSGIYAGDIHTLSVRSCFPLIHNLEKEHGSLIKGAFARSKARILEMSPFVQKMLRESLFSFRNGMATLPRTLEERLKESIKFNCSPQKLELYPDRICVTTTAGKILEADYLFSTLPAHAIAPLLSFEPTLSTLVGTIPSASVHVINLGYRSNVLEKQGFGYLVPSQEQESILGVVWDSSVFPAHNRHSAETRLTVMMGGMRHPFLHLKTEEELLGIALSGLTKHLGLSVKPDMVHSYTAKQAIPQYLVGHSEKLRAIEQKLKSFPRLKLLGNAFYGVSINDCIAQAKIAAAKNLI